MAKIALLYLPVLHEGYRQFLASCQKLDVLYLIEQSWLVDKFDQLNYLRKDIRCLPLDLAQTAVESWQVAKTVQGIGREQDLPQLNPKDQVYLSDDDIGQALATLWPDLKPQLQPIFLRWDRDAALEKRQVETQNQITGQAFVQKYMSQAFQVASQSSDWWRHVGAVLLSSDGEVLITAANRHQPNDQTPYTLGDTRALFKQGEYIEMSTALHAESAVIGAAAKLGISTAGCQLYVTDFPCPYCARLVAAAGISQLFFARGYTVLDGEQILQNAGVNLVRVILPENLISQADQSTYLKPYPER